jgi:hypothetical protein
MDPNGIPIKKPICERRSQADRRAKPTPFISRYWLIGKRRGGRRVGEQINLYVDKYTTYEWLIVIGLLVLSIADATLTLTHLSHGGAEANPIMALAYRGGRFTFVAIKMCLTVLSMFLFFIHLRFRTSHLLLAFSFVVYAGVFLYHQTLPIIAQ